MNHVIMTTSHQASSTIVAKTVMDKITAMATVLQVTPATTAAMADHILRKMRAMILPPIIRAMKPTTQNLMDRNHIGVDQTQVTYVKRK
jgi:cellobiose-specific phosphotransferase system component IIB